MKKQCTLRQLPITTYQLNPYAAVFNRSTVWSNYYPYNSSNAPIVLDVQFLEGTTPDNLDTSTWDGWEKAWIAKIITESIMKYANITFIFHINDNIKPSGKPDFEIKMSRLTKQGCYSSLGDSLYNNTYGYGYISPSDIGQTMNFGWMDAPYNTTFTYNGTQYTTGSSFENGGYVQGLGTTIIHEFGHAIGMTHELQTPFNYPFIWNTTSVYNFYSVTNNWDTTQVNDQVLRQDTSTNLNGSAFDMYSIMKYSSPACLLQIGNGYNLNNNGSDPCSIFINNTNPTNFYNLNASTNNILPAGNYLQQNNLLLSECDKAWIIKNYPGKTILGPSPICLLSSYNDPNPTPIPQQPTPTPQQPTPTPLNPTPTPLNPTPTPQQPTPTPQQPTPTPQLPTPTPQLPTPTPQLPTPTPLNPTPSKGESMTLLAYVLLSLIALILLLFCYRVLFK